jgi:hypothetical protein
VIVNAHGTSVIGFENVAVCVEKFTVTVLVPCVMVQVPGLIVMLELLISCVIFIVDTAVQFVTLLGVTAPIVSPVHVAVCVTGVLVYVVPLYRKVWYILATSAFAFNQTE